MRTRTTITGLSVTAIAFLCTACSKPRQPILSGGKPLSHWVQGLSSPDAKLRKTAVAKLGNAGPLDPDVAPMLLKTLHDSSAPVRCEAIVAITKLGSQAKQTIPDLQAVAQNDRDANVRDFAQKAIEKIK